MYIWQIEKLKQDIRANRFDERARFKYCLAYMVVTALVFELMGRLPAYPPDLLSNVRSIFNITVILIATILAYRANRGAQGKDFLGRYLSIGFVVTIRFIAYLLPISAGLFAYYTFAFQNEIPDFNSPVDLIIFMMWYGLLFWRIIEHIKDLNADEQPEGLHES